MKYSTEEVEIIKNNLGKKSFKEIAKLLDNKNEKAVSAFCSRHGMKNNFRPRKYFVNNDFFKNPNILNTYYASFIAGDGCIVNKSNSIIIELNPKDIEVLENFKRDCSFTGNIKYNNRKKYHSEERFQSISLKIVSKQMVEDLKNNFNVIERKTKRLAPPLFNMNKLLKMAYLVGYLDSDGSINFRLTDYNKMQPKIFYCSSSYEIVKFIKNTILEIFGIDLLIHTRKEKILFYIAATDSKAKTIIYWLNKIKVPKLKRKWENDNVKNLLKDFNPEKIQYNN